jgi:hypothetical protein
MDVVLEAVEKRILRPRLVRNVHLLEGPPWRVSSVNTPPPKGGGFGLRLKAGFGRPHGPTGANSETFILGAFVTTAW